jgi:short-subunit dehydrogenase
MKVKDRVVVITGAAGGIGSATAELLGRQGAILVLTDIKESALGVLKTNLEKSGAKVSIRIHDVTAPESWKGLTAAVLEEFGRIDILINNAGVVHPGAAEVLPLEKLHQQVSVNFLGMMHGCRAALPFMKKRGQGKIINVASLGGIVPMSGEAVYSATKAAIRAYTLSLAAELHGTPVKIAVVCPDSVDTPQLAYELEHDEAVLSFVGTAMKPEKVARGILKAIRGKKPEILVPAGMGVVARTAMAFPRLYLRFYPLLKKTGSKNIQKRRREKKSAS